MPDPTPPPQPPSPAPAAVPGELESLVQRICTGLIGHPPQRDYLLAATLALVGLYFFIESRGLDSALARLIGTAACAQLLLLIGAGGLVACLFRHDSMLGDAAFTIRRATPVIFILTLITTCAESEAARRWLRPGRESVNLIDVFIVGCALTYLAVQMRMTSLAGPAVPLELRPRPRLANPQGSLVRSPETVENSELLFCLLIVPLGVLAGTALAFLLAEQATPSQWPAATYRLGLVVWLVGLVLLTAAVIFAHVRRTQQDPNIAQQMLMDTMWVDWHNEQAKFERWRVWGQSRRRNRGSA